MKEEMYIMKYLNKTNMSLMGIIILIDLFDFAIYLNTNTLMVLARVLIAVNIVIAVLSIVQDARAEKSFQNMRTVEDIDEALKQSKRTLNLNSIFLVSLILVDLVKAADCFINGNYITGFVNLAVAIFLVWVFNNSNKGLRDRVKQLLGEKSRALRDKLVATQKGLSPQPLPGNA